MKTDDEHFENATLFKSLGQQQINIIHMQKRWEWYICSEGNFFMGDVGH
jgi:hypothetical protein